jgi:hypothetical protein
LLGDCRCLLLSGPSVEVRRPPEIIRGAY